MVGVFQKNHHYDHQYKKIKLNILPENYLLLLCFFANSMANEDDL